jgi:hypothetical protein
MDLLRMGLVGAMVALGICAVLLGVGIVGIVFWHMVSDVLALVVETGYTWVLWAILGIAGGGFIGGVLFDFVFAPPMPPLTQEESEK